MTQDKQALRAALAAIEPGDDASSYAELSRVLRSTSESLKTDIVAHVFTDLQKSSLARQLFRSETGRWHEARDPSGGVGSGAELDRRERGSAAARFRHEEGADGGHDRRLRHAGGRPESHSSGQRQAARDQSR